MVESKNIEASSALLEPSIEQSDTGVPIVWGLTLLFRHHGRIVSPRSMVLEVANSETIEDETVLTRICKKNNFDIFFEDRALDQIPALTLPVLLYLSGGRVCILRQYGKNSCLIQDQDAGTRPVSIATSELTSLYTGKAVFVRANESQIPTYLNDEKKYLPNVKHWFWSVLWKFRYVYVESAIASFIINILTLAGSLFAMNVYDRVIPNNATNTLWVLAIGVIIAYVIGFFLTLLRSHFLDKAAKKADLILSAEVFEQTMALRLENRPNSAGNYAGQMREFETVRDFFTSASLIALADLPFIFLFLWVIYLVAGSLVYVPLILIPIMLIFGIVAQLPLYKLVRGYLRVNTNKNAILIETLQGFESLKALGAERFMRYRWEHANLQAANNSLKIREISSVVSNVNQFFQQSASVFIIVWGAYLVHEGLLTTGALVATSILTSRSLGPVARITGLFLRIQQTMESYSMLKKIMDIPPERDNNASYLHKPTIQNHIQFNELKYAYNKDSGICLDIPNFTVNVGEHIGIIGRIGSGKSTFLKALATLYKPTVGNVLIDGIDAQQIDSADRRSNLGYIAQEPVLFKGTLRDNLLLGNPYINDDHLIQISNALGISSLASQHPKGFDMPIGEGGVGLSGGQKQLIVIARMLLLDPPFILLDEPTNSLDQHTEQLLLKQLKLICKNKTLVLVTHKPALINLVDRLIVLEKGKIVVDGPKEQVLNQLKNGISI